jgi:WD40 repeat protein
MNLSFDGSYSKGLLASQRRSAMRQFPINLSRRSFLQRAGAAGVSSVLLAGVTCHGQENAKQIARNRFRIAVSNEPLTVATVGLGMPIDWVPGQIEHRRHNRVLLWDARTGKLKHELDGSIDSRCFAFHPNGKTIVAGRDSGVVRIWLTATGKEYGNLTATNAGDIESVDFDPKGQFLFAGDWSLHKWRWDNDPKQSRVEDVQDAQGHTFFVAHPETGDVLYSAASSRIASRHITGKIIKQIERPHGDAIVQLVAARGGKWIATRSGDKIKIWNSSLEEHRSLPVSARQRICFHPRLPILVVSGATTQFLSLADATVVGEHPGHEATCVAVSPNGELLATAKLDMNLTVWQLTTKPDAVNE